MFDPRDRLETINKISVDSVDQSAISLITSLSDPEHEIVLAADSKLLESSGIDHGIDLTTLSDRKSMELIRYWSDWYLKQEQKSSRVW